VNEGACQIRRELPNETGNVNSHTQRQAVPLVDAGMETAFNGQGWQTPLYFELNVLPGQACMKQDEVSYGGRQYKIRTVQGPPAGPE
jgi:hypothetical protein